LLIKIKNSFWKDKKVVVTGHTGFKGSWLSLWLNLMGAQVYGISLPPKKLSLYKSIKLENIISGSFFLDIRDRKKITNLLIKLNPDIIFHLAAQPIVKRSYFYPLETYDVNITGTINILNSFRYMKKLRSAVIVTTDKCYLDENLKTPYKENDRLGGDDPYSCSKAAVELIVESFKNSFFSKNKKIFIATARSGNIIGGGDWGDDRLIPDLMRSILHKNILKIRYPNSIRPWQYILEPLSGYLLLAEKLFQKKNIFSTSFNFGPLISKKIKVITLIKLFAKYFEFKILYKLSKLKHHKETKYLSLNISKAQKILKWKPKLNFTQSVVLTANWYKKFIEYNNNNLLDETVNQIIKYSNLKKNER
jgi:CDP-glucose 4,6-dehydratase